MIDQTPAQSPDENGGGKSASETADRRELFLDLFDKAAQQQTPTQSAADLPPKPHRNVSQPAASGKVGQSVAPPTTPTTLADCGLTAMQVCDLAMKELYLHGSLLGVDIARHMRLPYPIVDEALRSLKASRIIEVTSGDVIGTATYRFNLTDLGTSRARDTIEKCSYVGPAPVSLQHYLQQCRRQAVSEIECSIEALQQAMADIIVREGLLAELGPAVCSGKSVFIYGPPGNGKTIVAKALGLFLNQFGGDIYVPYAIQTENSIITLFDPTLHQTTDDEDLHTLENGTDEFLSGTPDLRWRRIRRPVIITGGELTLDMLELRYNTVSHFYNAPLHIKANGGVFLIDDFGRQLVSPQDLLNRWILPLEEHADYLTLATGKKIEVPFEQLIIFSTNIDPSELVDEAFLRRIRHKIKIDSPTRTVFNDIFQLTCDRLGLEFNGEAIDYLFTNFYDKGRLPRSSDPRDLLEIIVSICRFTGQPLKVTTDLIAEATDKFFCNIEV